jgi:zinc transport system substrate-binding protein
MRVRNLGARARRVLVLAAVLLAFLHPWPSGQAAPEGPAVVVTIKPVHSLVAGVMEGAGSPALLLRGGASPHALSLRPSDARMLERASVIFWVGERLETFLARPLAALGREARVVTLIEEAPTLFATRKAGAWEAHEPAEGPPAAAKIDPHVWQDPSNAKAIVEAAAAALGAADPSRGALYRENADKLHARIDALDDELQAVLAPVSDVPFVVFHDAYQYFERHYGLNAVASITLTPEQKPGVRRVSEIRRKIEEAGAGCVFTEPQFEPALARTVLAGTGARTAVLDPLGTDIPPGPDAYFTLMRRLAQALRDCLASNRRG